MDYLKAALPLVLLTLSIMPSQAQQKDSSTEDKEPENSAIFLNASSDSKPREVSLGLPTNNTGAVQIFEDGLPVSYYIYQLYPYKSWHGGVSAASNGTMGPMEAAMRYCEINNYVDSYNKTGSPTFNGTVSYTIGSWGQNKLDINISGPIAGGWTYSLSTYQNFDPGSNHTVVPMLKDRHQFYKGVIGKRFGSGKGSMNLVYQHVDYINIMENFGPFVFVGDGSVKSYNGFNLGVDSYRPSLTHMTFMDIYSGEMCSMSLQDGNHDKTDHLTFSLDYQFNDFTSLVFRSRYKTGTSIRGGGTMAGIENVSSTAGYTYEDGSPYTGYLQKRVLLHFDAFDDAWINNAELKLQRGVHHIRIGADYNHNHGGTKSSSANYAHVVEADPDVLLFQGQRFYNFNSSGEYYNGFENKAAFYLKDEFNIGKRLSIEAFLRSEYLNIHGHAANNIGDDKSNSRFPGFCITKNGKVTEFKENYLNGSFGGSLTYKIVGGLAFQAEGLFTRIHSTIFNYGGYYDPSTDPTDTKFVRAGLSYSNSWVNVVSQVNYISQTNYNTRTPFQHELQKAVGSFPAGYIETVTLLNTYGIESFGWTTDAMFTPSDGLSIHAGVTIRDPRYKKFEFSPTFSDGVTEHYDFSGNNVTNLHKVEISIDPSYRVSSWRLWLSTRYISKQYINKTNSLHFKGRLETFGGIDYTLSKSTKLSLNVINILNQKGASGSISSADLVEDASGFKNYVMAGTFIRPFTVELGVNISF